MGKFRDRYGKRAGAKIEPRRNGSPGEREGRKASAPLYVMLEPGEKERYEQLARELNVTMRDLVRMAIEKLVAERNAAALATPAPESTDPSRLAEQLPTEFPEHSEVRRRYLFDFVLGSKDPPARGAISATLHQVERLRRLEDAVARILRRLDAANIREVSTTEHLHPEALRLLETIATDRGYRVQELGMPQAEVVRALREFEALRDRNGVVYVRADWIDGQVDSVRLEPAGVALKTSLGL